MCIRDRCIDHSCLHRESKLFTNFAVRSTHTSFKQQSNSNRIFTGYILVQYRITDNLNYLPNCTASGMEHPRSMSMIRVSKTTPSSSKRQAYIFPSLLLVYFLPNKQTNLRDASILWGHLSTHPCYLESTFGFVCNEWGKHTWLGRKHVTSQAMPERNTA